MPVPLGPLLLTRQRGRILVWAAWLALVSCVAPSPSPNTEAPEPVTVAILVSRAEEAGEKGDLDVAISAYGEALERTPWNDRLRRTLAAAHAERALRTRAEQGVFGLDSAERDLREAFQLDPELDNVRQNLAVVIVERAIREMDPERARQLREEAYGLDPEVAEAGRGFRADVERRLDLAYQLVERGQLDAGIERLESLHADHPDHAPTTRLLGQVLVRKATLRAERGRHEEAGSLLDRAIRVYGGQASGGSPTAATEPGLREEMKSAHRSRVVAWINAGKLENARSALEEAETAGFRFPDLRRAVGF
jgi:tetratricopeptide (TPR) repeat protein